MMVGLLVCTFHRKLCRLCSHFDEIDSDYNYFAFSCAAQSIMMLKLYS